MERGPRRSSRNNAAHIPVHFLRSGSFQDHDAVMPGTGFCCGCGPARVGQAPRTPASASTVQACYQGICQAIVPFTTACFLGMTREPSRWSGEGTDPVDGSAHQECHCRRKMPPHGPSDHHPKGRLWSGHLAGRRESGLPSAGRTRGLNRAFPGARTDRTTGSRCLRTEGYR